MKKYSRKYIVVRGIVQGVGFRPFVYKIAVDNNLSGWVKNTSEGVFIDIEGKNEKIEAFLHDLRCKAPPLSKINEIIIEDREIQNYSKFTIEKSHDNEKAITLISPDVATCSDCEREIKDIKDKRFNYPFINCTNCGPRFSIIKKLPYDRPMTTMKEFKMCEECNLEYENPLDRRFHAQPNACAICGPKVWLTDTHGNKINVENPINEVKGLLMNGKIIGIKGLGGFHLVCNGENQQAIETLRKRKVRPSKPFALMMRDIDTVKKYCYVNETEEKTLLGIKKPILLLDKKDDTLPNNTAPNNNRLGIMLPYTPLHYLLFDKDMEVLIMTSANVSGLPIEYKNEGAVEKLNKIVDYFLLHNREIHIPVDDSVARVVLGKERVIRRSRGYAPMPVIIKEIRDTLAYGAHLKNTFCISKEDFAFMSQHMGDMDNLETLKNYEYNVKHFKGLYNIEPELIAYDMHPDFMLSNFAKEAKGEKYPVQHHHAHIASCMIENKIHDKVIGIAFDGTGYGTDGKIWGGEFLICDYKDFNRIGHLNYVKMAGGDKAVKEPWRMAVSYLYEAYKENIDTSIIDGIPEKNKKTVLTMIKNNLNTVETSSMGRFFDAVSALIGLKNITSFEGEAAINLETISDMQEEGIYDYRIDNENQAFIIDTCGIIKNIIKDMKDGVIQSIIAKKFHNTVVHFSVHMCKLIRNTVGINKVALSGGVFQNEILLKGICKCLTESNFEVFIHGEIPCNDGGISIGQLVIANHKAKDNK